MIIHKINILIEYLNPPRITLKIYHNMAIIGFNGYSYVTFFKYPTLVLESPFKSIFNELNIRYIQ